MARMFITSRVRNNTDKSILISRTRWWVAIQRAFRENALPDAISDRAGSSRRSHTFMMLADRRDPVRREGALGWRAPALDSPLIIDNTVVNNKGWACPES